MTLKRIHREISDLQKEDLGKIALGPQDMDNPFLWKARIPGPEGSVYEGGVFEVDVQLANDYPYVHAYLFSITPWVVVDGHEIRITVSRHPRFFFALGMSCHRR